MKNYKETLFFAILTAACIAAVFSSTIFLGKPISRFDLIEKLDALYDSNLLGADITVTQDPSACLQSIPKEIFIRHSLQGMQVPTWNPLSGCGQPIMADPANTLWNPIDLICAPTNQWLYNIGIVLKIGMGGVISYLLFLRNGAAPWAACTASIGFALSPRILRSTELATNFEFLPAVFLVFSFVSVNSSNLRLGICAAALALCYLSLHPEVFFVAVSTATFLWICNSRATEEKGCGIGSSILTISKLALLSIALVAPFLFAFFEYLQFAHSYKFSGSLIEFIPITQLPFFLAVPKLSPSLFTGTICFLGLPFGLCLAFKKNSALLTVLTVLILFSCRPHPFDQWFAQAPFSYLLPEYALGPILLLLCSTAATGLTELNLLSAQRTLPKLFFASYSLLVWLLPLVVLHWMPGTAGVTALVTSKSLLFSFLLLLVITVILLTFPLPGTSFPVFLRRNESFDNARISLLGLKTCFYCSLAIALPIFNLATMIAPVKAELVRTKTVLIPPANRAELFETLLTAKNSRIAACGSGLLAPNTAIIYGLNDLRSCSPLNERRYLSYMKAAGAELAYCNMMQLPGTLNRLIDLAGVELLLSTSPLRSSGENLFSISSPKQEKIESPAVRFMPGIRLRQASCAYTPSAAEIEVNFSIRVHDLHKSRYQSRIVLLDQAGRQIWQSTLQNLSFPDTQANEHLHKVRCLVPVPVRNVKQVAVVLRILDSWTAQYIEADGGAGGNSGGNAFTKDKTGSGFTLASFFVEREPRICSPDGRFTLIYETPDLVRVYRNNSAKKRAYLVCDVIPVNSGEESLRRICRDDFDSDKQATVEWVSQELEEVINQKQSGWVLSKKTCEAGAQDRLVWAKDTNTEVSFECHLSERRFLVLADLYYPGWEADIDGKPAPILRTNYMFRGLFVPAGKHKVVFRYTPAALKIGLALQCLFLLLTLILLVVKQSEKAKK